MRARVIVTIEALREVGWNRVEQVGNDLGDLKCR